MKRATGFAGVFAELHVSAACAPMRRSRRLVLEVINSMTYSKDQAASAQVARTSSFATSSRSSTRVNLPSNGAWRSAYPHASRPAPPEQQETCFCFFAFVP